MVLAPVVSSGSSFETLLASQGHSFAPSLSASRRYTCDACSPFTAEEEEGGGAFVVRFGTQHTKERGKVCLHSLPEEEEVSLIMKRRNLSVVAHRLRVEKCLQTPLDSSTQSSPKVVEDYFWKIVLKRIAVA